MWTLNTDTGKWSNQTDTLSYDVYTNLKQDLQSLRLFSKCLSGSTYLPINKLTDIYDVLNYEKVGFWATTPPISGSSIMPSIIDNNTISDEFYNKYLKENAFTLKNLFTPNKLINDQLTNYVYVDVATTDSLTNVTGANIGLTIDGVLLKEGHRVLVKDQRTEVTIPYSTDPDIYFGSTNYHLLDTFGTEATYYYFNNQNGVYKYTNNRLVMETDLDTYEGAYRYSVSVKLGSTNRDNQFHLARRTDGYYPETSDNKEFQPKHNWVLRNRVDYHNIYDNNYYDILHHGDQTYVVAYPGSGTVSTTYMTYSIPARTVAVGDFGVIIDNQDKLTSGSTFSVSLIIDNKYKSNIRSIAEIDGYYWCCGDNGTLLKVSKIDFSISSYNLNETSQLTSISFFNSLYGMAVGKYNTIYYTFDGGNTWKKLTFPEFDIYSYNKVVQYSINQAYIGGETGVFIEMNYSTSGWIAYKRKITKQLTTYDQYDLVDDINDMSPLLWTTIPTYNYTQDSTSVDFANNLTYTSKIVDGNNLLQISVNSPYFGNSTFSGSSFYIGFRITDVTTSTYVYTSPNFGDILPILPPYNTWDIWQYGTVSSNLTFTQSLPVDVYGRLENSSYLVESNIIYNWDGLFGTVSGYEQPFTPTSWTLNSVKSKQLIIVTNQDNIITYDIDNVISPISNQFVYLTFSQSHSDIQTVTTNKYDVYIGGDNLYRFNFTQFTNIGNTATNIATGTSSIVSDLYVNKLYSTTDNLYLSGNYGLLNKWDYSTTFDSLDPGFDSRIQSKLLFLDYDIASKLNFFNSDGQYVLPSSVSIPYGVTSLSIDHLVNETNWLDYYKDSEKTFKYYSSIDDSNVVKFSSSFTKVSPSYSSWTFSSSNLTISYSNIAPYAPNINSSTASRFISGSVALSTIDPIPTGNIKVYVYKYLVIFIIPNNYDVSVGDVLNFSSSMVNCNLVVNRINVTSVPSPIPFGYTGQKKIVYCYSDFNQNIINGLDSGITTVTNLNRFTSYTNLISNFNNHKIGIGYKVSDNGSSISLEARFNNKTAYYNMQSSVLDAGVPTTLTTSTSSAYYFTGGVNGYTIPETKAISTLLGVSLPNPGDTCTIIANGWSTTFTFVTTPSSGTNVQIVTSSTAFSNILGTLLNLATQAMIFSSVNTYIHFVSTTTVSGYAGIKFDAVSGYGSMPNTSPAWMFNCTGTWMYSPPNVYFLGGVDSIIVPTTNSVLSATMSFLPNDGDTAILVRNSISTTFTFRTTPVVVLTDVPIGLTINSSLSNLRSKILAYTSISSYIGSSLVSGNNITLEASGIVGSGAYGSAPNSNSNWNLSFVDTTVTTISSLYGTSSMVYGDHFLKFGYSPTYNILDYLSNIDPIFTSSKVLSILPQYYSLSGGPLTDDTIWIDTGISTNKIYFGTNLKNKWESLLINTFVDVNCDSYSTERLLIIGKSYDTNYGAYYIEFHKKVNTGITNVTSFDIISRNTLGQISEDLQLLNNIQRTSTVRTIQYAHSVTNLENEIKSKFFTDSYMKALVSDYDVRNKLSAIIYIDSDNQLAMNVIHVEKEFVYDITSISNDGLGNTLLNLSSIHELNVTDGVIISGTNSYSGYTTIISNPGLNQIVIAKPYSSSSYGLGQVTFIKKDPFFNFQPIDLFNYGSDQSVTRSVEVKPENFELTTTGYQITGLDLTNYKMQFVDGLSLTEVNNNYPWLLEAEISNAIIGRDSNGPIWYSGTWLCGRWFGGTWISGKWVSGDWYSGTWSAFNNTYNIISVKVDTSYVDDTVSKWYNGRWFDGTWKGGTWYNGRRYAGDWQRGNWYNGIWNDGHWINGSFGGGIWVKGTWDAGTFNCNSKPSYWLDGSFKSGDFENGMWYNGQFGNMNNLLSRFGTKSTNTRNSTWQGGKWLNGQFHSYLNTDDNGNPIVSDIHKFSIWKTGTWYSGSWYGGIAYNIDFKSGVWYGGILEEIQVVGVGSIIPATYSTNSIFVNGDFMFNIGDEVWVIDDYYNGAFSPLGNNDNPMMYRINKIVEYPSTDLTYPNQTQLYLNYNLSSLGVASPYSGLTYSNLDMHLRLVSHFKEAKWYNGIWSNGIFDGGTFYSGIWYNGVFNGTWGV